MENTEVVKKDVVTAQNTDVSCNQQTNVHKYVDSLSGFNFFDEQQMVAFKNFATELMRSEKGGIKSVNDALAIAMRAQALNLPFGTSLDHIHVINGKTGVDIHIIKALLMRAGCSWKCTKRYQPLYEYTDGINIYNDGAFPEYVKRCNNKQKADKLSEKDVNNDYCYVYPVKWYKDFKGNLYKDYQLNVDQFKVVRTAAEAAIIMKENKIPIYRCAASPIDYVFEYEFTRTVNGEKMTAISSFSYTEAVAAGFLEKDVWKKYLQVMMSHRAFTFGARDIASDVIMGCMETTELKIITDSNLNDADFVDAEVIE